MSNKTIKMTWCNLHSLTVQLNKAQIQAQVFLISTTEKQWRACIAVPPLDILLALVKD